MHLRCRMSNHVPAANPIENRGFAFSRCQRCRCDLLLLLGCSRARWRAVPPGFRISWRTVDPTVFDPPSWRTRLLSGVQRRHEALTTASSDAIRRVSAATSNILMPPLRLVQCSARDIATLTAAAFRGCRRILGGCVGLIHLGIAAIALARWQIKDAIRTRADWLNARVLAARQVIRLRAIDRPAQVNFVINLHLHPLRQ